MNLTDFKPQRAEQGFTLIEVLIAIIVMAIGFLGVTFLQIRTVQEQRSAQFMGRAALLAGEMAERMRANRLGVETGLYVTPATARTYQLLTPSLILPPANPCGGVGQTACTTAAGMFEYDLYQWRLGVQAGFSGGAGLLTNTSATGNLLPANQRRIVVAWREPVTDLQNNTPNLLTDPTCPTELAQPAGVRCYVLQFTL